MIIGLEGNIVYKEPSSMHLDVNGVVYEVFISLHTYSALSTERIRVHTTHIIREDAQQLYGFIQKGEKTLFEGMLKINGIGPKAALAICSTFTPEQFAGIITSKDVNALKKVPGIGPKSAGRIMVELAGFDAVLLQGDTVVSNASSEASMALESLGFKREQIAKALSASSATDTASLVKEALKQLQKL
ncbi:MAG TPA: Holliday junction branch migration protein RuvA [Sulfuricurvum sp.]|nr:MAG: Holliday junction branch migration protein RuvA [Campylobacterales bacterium 16-40-21]OZA04123.1 MAG: Holliday junction branch migration protein RuvA [Sulfuricurvum sp. 17-40-25]HQS66129.1 Holliday junction branch migration protein RuvA [Sulfuricurvum sp.]HQT35493.1 Holliday junction branch migration protein RuvA [Sulfuricurvum sp.]